ncbi:MAG: excinuclease ABC subunit UvrA [Candidatus Krumholzibacteria bacterium]|nr:excinuclease ABC subunit UvrA [Candidatus Krumholzibacteria bacterium]
MTTARHLVIRGAREHNLKNISLSLPRNKLIVVTGLSGSGKSSLAFDTIYAEGQRRYVESLSAYARQFLGQMEKPDVDRIEGLSPAISIEQKTSARNPRSTVGTMTEIYDYLRLLFARVGVPHCYKCGRVISQQTVTAIAERINSLPANSRVMILSPIVRGRKGEHVKVLERIGKEGFVRVRVDGELYDVDNAPKLHRQKKHNIEIVVDRLTVTRKNAKRIVDSLETAGKYSQGVVLVEVAGKNELLFSQQFACPYCEVSFGELSHRLFSFNSPYGACKDCGGLGAKMEFNVELVVPDRTLTLGDGALAPLGKLRGEWGRQQLKALGSRYKFDLDTPFAKLDKKAVDAIFYGSDEEITVKLDFENVQGEYRSKYEGLIPWLRRRHRQTKSDSVHRWIESYMTNEVCPSCAGSRLRVEARAVRIAGRDISEVCGLSVKKSLKWLSSLELEGNDLVIAEPILKEIVHRLQFLVDVGLDYLSLDRNATTLAGGEAQRLRLATQIGSRLMGVLYILDEPSIGLHHRDNGRLIRTLKNLRDLGNTVVVIEHDRETILSADHVVDLGPGAGLNGGHVVAEGSVADIKESAQSLTGSYLRLADSQTGKERSRLGNGRSLVVRNARENNLKNIDVSLPLGLFTCVTGVSGSGKSTLVNDILFRALRRRFFNSHVLPGQHDTIEGVEHIDKVIDIDQSPIGRTPRSNPATYTGMFTPIRDLFSQLSASRVRGYKVGRFSFNVSGGRCEKCQGDGLIKVEMHFLPDVYVKCETCKGKRYNHETLEVMFKGHNISDVLNMTVDEAHELFINIPSIRRKCEVLRSVGLGYIHLGQSAVSLSGGEAQRVKLAAQLSKRGTGKTLYILDEPTTGLHHYDVRMLVDVLDKLVDKGNTVVVIEHNPDVILAADHLVDLGPEGGEEGGEVVASGTPRDIMKCKESHTGDMLKNLNAACESLWGAGNE